MIELLEHTLMVSAGIFALIAVITSFKEEKTKKLLTEREKKYKQQLYQISILKEIQDRIGYELNIEKVVDVITGSLKSLFPYSTTSSLIIKDDKIIFKTIVEEPVSKNFIDQIKKNLLASLTALTSENIPGTIEESLSGVALVENNLLSPASFFNIPLIINNNVVGLINISSVKQGLYKEDEMTILYQITNQASNAVSRLLDVLTTEKGKLMAMIQSMADGVLMIGRNNELLIINDTAKRMLDIQKDSPTIIDVFERIPKDHNFSGKIDKVITGNNLTEKGDIQINDKTVQIIISPVSTIGATVLLHDVTLEKNIAETKENFTYMVVHELRAPLTAIRGASSLMVSEKSKLNDEEQVKMLRIINEQSKQLLEEISSLLDAAKIEAGRFTINKTLTNIQELVQKRIQFYSPYAEDKKINLSADFANELPQIMVDPVRIEQVINNLISNSLKFTPEEGKITIDAKVLSANQGMVNQRTWGDTTGKAPDSAQSSGFAEGEEARRALTGGKVVAGPQQRESELLISVSDTGIGIPKEKQPLLFARFSQVAYPQVGEKPTLIPSGTGLGLYIVKGIIEAHGGKVKLESELNKGTSVTVSLPI